MTHFRLLFLVLILGMSSSSYAMNLNNTTFCMNALLKLRTSPQAKAAQKAKETLREFRQMVLRQPLHGATLDEANSHSGAGSDSEVTAVAKRIEGIEQQEGKAIDPEDPSHVTFLAAELTGGEAVNDFFAKFFENYQTTFSEVLGTHLLNQKARGTDIGLGENRNKILNTWLLAMMGSTITFSTTIVHFGNALNSSASIAVAAFYLMFTQLEAGHNFSGKVIDYVKNKSEKTQSQLFFKNVSEILQNAETATAPQWSYASFNFDLYKSKADSFLNPTTSFDTIMQDHKSTLYYASYGFLHGYFQKLLALIARAYGHKNLKTKVFLDVLLQTVQNQDGEMVPKLTIMARLSGQPKVEVKVTVTESSKETLTALVPIRATNESRK